MSAGARRRATLPTEAQWRSLARTAPRAPVVDVVVPAYKGLAETMRCLYGVLAAPAKTAFELWVVNDASPDPRLAAALDELSAAGSIRLVRNAVNAGFVRSANIGLQLHPERDVVLLNADTEVFGDWLDRLRRAASRPMVGTVTPFTHYGGICSYPLTLRDNDDELELPDADLDAIFADVNRGACVDLPTAVGFCVYITRACLRDVGFFDEARFGFGYGEENDFSRRALRAGWRNVLAADVFVRHYGGVSFGESKAERLLNAYETVKLLHPDYEAAVTDHIARDPLLPFRRRVDYERIRRSSGDELFLFVSHGRGGGTERNVLDMSARITADGGSVIVCRSENRLGNLLHFDVPWLCVPNLPTLDVSAGVEPFVDALDAMGVTRIHVHHVVDLPPYATDAVRAVAERRSLAYDVTVHDYFYVCPRITLIDDSGFYCGEPDASGCARCLSRVGSGFGAPAIADWRERCGRFLNGARSVFVPDVDVRRRYERYFPRAAYVVRPHPEEAGSTAPPLLRDAPIPAASSARHRSVAVIGAVGAHKGSAILLDCARLARERELPIDFSVIGFSDMDQALEGAGVTITGPYEEAALQALLERTRPDLAWFPSPWPETYCYTLSGALRARIFPVAFDLGAPANRLRALGWGDIMPLELLFDAERIVDRLANVPIVPFPVTVTGTIDYSPRFIAGYYGPSVS